MKRTSLLSVAATVAMVVLPGIVSAQAIRAGFNTTLDGRNDDGTYTAPAGCSNPLIGGTCAGTLVPIGFNADLFGTTFSSVYLNTNGNITLDSPQSEFTPFGLTGGGVPPILAPFFADVDTRNPASGVLTFGNGTVDGHDAFGVNWPGVGYFGEHADKLNTFQLILIDRGDLGVGDFDFEFNYGNMLWETGDASGGNNGFGGSCAAVGYSNGQSGANNNSFELPGSHDCGALIDGGVDALNTHSLNSDIAGRYLFQVREGDVLPPVTTTPEPSAVLLLGTGLLALAFVVRRRQMIG